MSVNWIGLVGIAIAACACAEKAADGPDTARAELVGDPATAARVAHAYGFTPTAVGFDRATTIFSIDGQPAWTGFDSTSGSLSGVPDLADVGLYDGIVIDAADGAGHSAALPAFSIDVRRDATATGLAGGQDHACAVLEDGSVRCWGNNLLGQLGIEDTENRGDDSGEMGDDLSAVDLGNDAEVETLSAGWAMT